MRLAELAGILSLATDAGTGMPDEHGLRVAILAVRIGEVAGASDDERRDAFYLALLHYAGCTSESDRAAALFGDEIEFGGTTLGLDYGRAAEMMPAIMRFVRRGRGALGGLAAMAKAMAKMPSMLEVGRAHCEVAAMLAGRLGFDAAFQAAIAQGFERWDGSGRPGTAKQEQIARAMRIAHVAIDADVGVRLGGVETARAFVKKHARRGLDPELAERFVAGAASIVKAIEVPSIWTAMLAAEPAPHRVADDDAIDAALDVLADFTDMKSRFTRGHSPAVAARAAAAATRIGLGAPIVKAVRRAGLVHDVGRVAVSASIWDKTAPLTDAEREKIRLHTYVGERVLARATALADAAEIATAAHERLDGGGYHRRLAGASCTAPARLLAAADVYCAMIADRPHRPALTIDAAAAELRAMAARGALCPDAVDAVLASDSPSRAKKPGALTERELEVLRLVARGLTNKEVASALSISTKTAGHHVQHIFEKLGVTTRAGATMAAMQRGLV
ncbi:MAG TPA: HD domain-containing phosphohydrolase [Kofleriaceae bacterium]|nr:HD domain-containing phosphohydrolase [Kofleriaceae bacterium]